MAKQIKNLDEFIRNTLNSILEKNGMIYTEQKFHNLFEVFEKLAYTKHFSGKLDYNSKKEYYEYLFPNLAPRLKNINIVFENATDNNNKEFNVKFHPSEKIYSEWIANYLTKNLSKKTLDKLIEEYKNWTNWHTEIKSIQFQIIKEKIRTDINREDIDLGNYTPIDNEIVYYLEKNVGNDVKLKIADRIDFMNNTIFVIEQKQNKVYKVSINPVVNVSSIKLNIWFKSIGIKLSLTTCQFLLEFGLPYCGYLIEPRSIFNYSNTGNTACIVGLIVYNLSRIKDGIYQEHPFKESVVLALSRLEYFLNNRLQ